MNTSPHLGTLVLRYHSLGDVVLTTGLVRALDGQAPGSISVATERRFFPVFEGNPHVARLWDRAELEDLVSRGEGPRFAQILDLQGTAGTRALTRRLGPVRTVRSRSLARRWIVLWGNRPPHPRIPHAVERYAEVAELARFDAAQGTPETFVTAEDRRALAEEAPQWQSPPDRTGVALLTGASRRSKAYPIEQFLEVGRLLEHQGVHVTWVADPAAPVGPSVGSPLRVGLSALKAALARIDLAISGDSGPMHLATSAGRPVLALFGSSVPAFGFAPLGNARLLQVEGLACRPCGVHGRDHCWRGHWRCLRDLSPDRIVAEALSMIGKEADR